MLLTSFPLLPTMCLQGIIQVQPLSADEAQRLYEAKEEAEKMISEQRLVEQERVRVRNEVLMRYNDGLREVTTAVKQINEKVQWLSASLGSRFTVLDYEKSGSRSGVEAVEKLTKQSEKLKVSSILYAASYSAVCCRNEYVCVYMLQSHYHTVYSFILLLYSHQDELEGSIDRVTNTLSDCDTKLVTMEENRAAVSVCACGATASLCCSDAALFHSTYTVHVLLQLQEEVLKRQLEVAALENTQEIKMRELERKEKVQ